MSNIESILRGHVALQVECTDRIYLGGYVGALQRPGQLCYFLTEKRGYRLPSPALLGQGGSASNGRGRARRALALGGASAISHQP